MAKSEEGETPADGKKGKKNGKKTIFEKVKDIFS